MDLRELLGTIGQPDEKEGTVMGVVDKRHIEKIHSVNESFNELKKSVQEQLEAYCEATMKEAYEKCEAKQRELEAKYEPQKNALNEEQESYWNDIYDELLIPKEEQGAIYTIHHETGVVERHDSDPRKELLSFAKFLKEATEQ